MFLLGWSNLILRVIMWGSYYYLLLSLCCRFSSARFHGTFIEHLLCAWHSARCWGITSFTHNWRLSELAIAKESAPSLVFGRTKGKQRSGKVLQWKQRKVSAMPWLEAAVIGNWRWAIYMQGNLCYRLVEHNWLFLVGSKLEVGPKLREAASNWSSSYYCGRIATEVVV